jgi:hypothetical protein
MQHCFRLGVRGRALFLWWKKLDVKYLGTQSIRTSVPDPYPDFRDPDPNRLSAMVNKIFLKLHISEKVPIKANKRYW